MRKMSLNTIAFLLSICSILGDLPLWGQNHVASKTTSICLRSCSCRGGDDKPYNFRSIDGKLFAGGSLLNPLPPKNSLEKVTRILRYLKKLGVKSIIALHVPISDNDELAILEKICNQEGLTLIKNRMNAAEVPNASQTDAILTAIDKGAYVHCQWGCDRTGGIIAKYLRVRKGYTGEQAWKAIIPDGTHSGPISGFKKKIGNKNLVLYFWPEVVNENRDVCEIYGIPFRGNRSDKSK